MQMRTEKTQGNRWEISRKCALICERHDCRVNICRGRAHAVFLSQSHRVCLCVCWERAGLIATAKSCQRLCSCYTDKKKLFKKILLFLYYRVLTNITFKLIAYYFHIDFI